MHLTGKRGPAAPYEEPNSPSALSLQSPGAEATLTRKPSLHLGSDSPVSRDGTLFSALGACRGGHFPDSISLQLLSPASWTGPAWGLEQGHPEVSMSPPVQEALGSVTCESSPGLAPAGPESCSHSLCFP